MFQINYDGLAKSREMPFSVIPAEAPRRARDPELVEGAEIQDNQEFRDPGFRRGDGVENFLQSHRLCGLVEVYNRQKRLGFQTGSTDKGSVDVRFGHEIPDIVGFDTPSIENPDRLGSRVSELCL